MDDREHSIQSAIADYNNGVYKSLRAVCDAYGLPRSTLRGRLAGRQSHAIAHQHQQRLTSEQEDLLAKWVLDEHLRAHPPSHARLREMAARILQMNGDDKPLGHLWVSHFLQRNPRIYSVFGRSPEATCTAAADHELIRAFLELFEQTRLRLGIPAEK